ncbi:ATP-binding protein [Fusibacter bizertensis]|uniref:ATP-binding protein n=1 Tax=Fusibacter bizertensis TaxID=1488331 RepID=A0ABT6NEN3_9FIRM|nr:ATP-binding protein [Fusibacter bizertensis]MDH8678876.1 ATP-binding protein [Fusibacter bizertensis]
MKFQIDIDKITLSPNGVQHVVTNEDMKSSLSQLKSQLANGNNSSILVSGYRGAGKTTLVKNLINEFNDERSVFIELNFTKRDSLSIIQRKLIRELYLSLEANKKFKLIKDKKLINQIKLLYDHTFFEISNISNLTELKEHSYEATTKFNLKI